MGEARPSGLPDDELLSAYVAGDVDDVTARRIERVIEDDPEVAARVEGLADLSFRLAMASLPPAGSAAEQVAVEAEVTSTALEAALGAQQQRVQRPRTAWRHRFGMLAAALAAGALLGGSVSTWLFAPEQGVRDVDAAPPLTRALGEQGAAGWEHDPFAALLTSSRLEQARALGALDREEATALAGRRWQTYATGAQPDRAALAACEPTVTAALGEPVVPVAAERGVFAGEPAVAGLVVAWEPQAPTMVYIGLSTSSCTVRDVTSVTAP